MEFDIANRKTTYKIFFKYLETNLKKDKNFTLNLYNNPSCKYISIGAEGRISKCNISDNIENSDIIEYIIKYINLKKIYKIKGLYKLFKKSQSKLYEYFENGNIFNKPTFTELIAFTLTNQLVFQKICPNFVLNYYWEFQNGKIREYNEYINCCTFRIWLDKSTYDRTIWLNVLFQIMISLYALQKYFGMLHTDFHLDNILVQNTKPGGYWKYRINGLNYYIPNIGFQILINDFGFAWIPKRLYIKWHLDNTLKYITKIGRRFYDLSKFIKVIYTTKKDYQPDFINLINSNFTSSELNYIFSKQYYIDNNKFKDTYPNITTCFNGNKMTLDKKIYKIFYKEYNTRQTNIIDSFSLDKRINHKKLPRNFKKLLN